MSDQVEGDHYYLEDPMAKVSEVSSAASSRGS